MISINKDLKKIPVIWKILSRIFGSIPQGFLGEFHWDLQKNSRGISERIPRICTEESEVK